MRVFLLCLTLAATQAFGADFEGIIIGKPVTSDDAAKAVLESMKMYLSSRGVRMELTGLGAAKARPGDPPFTLTTVWQTSEPSTVYVLNLTNKTYLKRDVSKAQQAAGATEAPKVEKLGTASFLGHTVQRVKVTFSGGRSQELWVDTSLRFPASALALFGQERGLAQNSPWHALEKAGIGGIPLKDLDNEGKWGWEATSVEKKSLPVSLFQVPAGYTEAKSPLDMLPPAQKAAALQQMNNMTPEQRAKLEEAMKKATQ